MPEPTAACQQLAALTEVFVQCEQTRQTAHPREQADTRLEHIFVRSVGGKPSFESGGWKHLWHKLMAICTGHRKSYDARANYNAILTLVDRLQPSDAEAIRQRPGTAEAIARMLATVEYRAFHETKPSIETSSAVALFRDRIERKAREPLQAEQQPIDTELARDTLIENRPPPRLDVLRQLLSSSALSSPQRVMLHELDELIASGTPVSPEETREWQKQIAILDERPPRTNLQPLAPFYRWLDAIPHPPAELLHELDRRLDNLNAHPQAALSSHEIAALVHQCNQILLTPLREQIAQLPITPEQRQLLHDLDTLANSSTLVPPPDMEARIAACPTEPHPQAGLYRRLDALQGSPEKTALEARLDRGEEITAELQSLTRDALDQLRRHAPLSIEQRKLLREPLPNSNNWATYDAFRERITRLPPYNRDFLPLEQLYARLEATPESNKRRGLENRLDALLTAKRSPDPRLLQAIAAEIEIRPPERIVEAASPSPSGAGQALSRAITAELSHLPRATADQLRAERAAVADSPDASKEMSRILLEAYRARFEIALYQIGATVEALDALRPAVEGNLTQQKHALIAPWNAVQETLAEIHHSLEPLQNPLRITDEEGDPNLIYDLPPPQQLLDIGPRFTPLTNQLDRLHQQLETLNSRLRPLNQQLFLAPMEGERGRHLLSIRPTAVQGAVQAGAQAAGWLIQDAATFLADATLGVFNIATSPAAAEIAAVATGAVLLATAPAAPQTYVAAGAAARVVARRAAQAAGAAVPLVRRGANRLWQYGWDWLKAPLPQGHRLNMEEL